MDRLCTYLFVCLIVLQHGSVSAQQIVAGEYFVDADPGVGRGIAVAGTVGDTGNFSFSIVTTALPAGFHTLGFRAKNNMGLWSHYENRVFYISSEIPVSGTITAAEYFLDTDPGVGLAIPIPVTGGDVVSLQFPVTNIPAGFHVLAVRVKNQTGSWSHYESQAFYINPEPAIAPDIVAAEYFVDTDPGAGLANALQVNQGSNVTIQFPVTNLSGGFHVLAVRTKNARGIWSHYESKPFYVSEDSATMPQIVAAEYFFDKDPGVGLGTSLRLNPTGDQINQTFLIPVQSGLGIGDHYFVLRVKDASGRWSHYQISDTIRVQSPTAITNLSNLTQKISVYPNPVSDVLQIQTDGFVIRQNIRLIDLKGNVLFRTVNNKASQQLNIAHLPAGAYIIVIEDLTNKETGTKLIVKQNQ
jgi:hypothetical protein